MRALLAALLVSLVLAGCAPSVYYVQPPDWRTREKQDAVIQTYSSYLKGWKFYIDPGHGGEDRFNHGPANDVVEADINLNVSLHLADYLRRAGATVILSRDKDTSVALSERPKMANASGADILISVHHNATGTNDRETNLRPSGITQMKAMQSIIPAIMISPNLSSGIFPMSWEMPDRPHRCTLMER